MSPSSTTAGSRPEKRPAQPDNDESSTHSLAACLDCRNRKVKCNRELPKCSNCKRSGVPCHFPNPEKKASQMKQLSEDVAQFNGRLSIIEKSLVGRMQELTELVTQSMRERSNSTTSKISPHRSPVNASSDLDDSDAEDDDLTGESGSQHRLSSSAGASDRPCSIIVPDGSGERFYGPCSTYSHMVRSKGLVEKFLNAGEQPCSAQMSRRSSSNASVADICNMQGTPLFNQVRHRYESFSGPANFQESFELGDDRPLELPPREILEEAIDTYVAGYSLEPPLFNKRALASAINEQYSANPRDLDESWVLCFNNIILRSSGWRSRAFRFNSFAPSSIDANVLRLLLSNANRALRQLEKFCVPRLVNVQALILLAFVGRDFIHYNVFARIFDRVCQLAKQMGLHERDPVSESSCVEDRQAQNVLWVLYLVDKQSIFVRGPPCRIYEFECNLRMPSAETFAEKLVCANLRLSCLIEEIYRHLYSPKAAKIDDSLRQRRVEKLDRRLSDLECQVETLTNSKDNSIVECTMGLHLKYAFCVTNLLILSHRSDKQSRQSRKDAARSALQIIQTLSDSGFGLDGGVVVLERLFCNYSVIAFHEIFESVMTDGILASTAADLELLRGTTRTLKIISQSERPFSYCTRLHKNFAWCTEIAGLVFEARRSASSSPQPPANQLLENSIPMSRHYPASLQSGSTPSPLHMSSNKFAPSQDLSDDTLMEDDMYGSLNARPTVSNFAAPSLSANDFANLQSVLDTQNYAFNGGDGLGFAGNMMPEQPAVSMADLSPRDNSARLQEALKYIWNMGGGFDGDFLQTNGDRTGMIHHGRDMARTSN